MEARRNADGGELVTQQPSTLPAATTAADEKTTAK